MNIVIVAVLLSIINFISCININQNNNHSLRNIFLRTIIFKEKSLPKTCNKMKQFFKKCYNKSIDILRENIIEYNNLSEEDKFLMDFIISSIL
jgi:hypothetical protein